MGRVINTAAIILVVLSLILLLELWMAEYCNPTSLWLWVDILGREFVGTDCR